MSVVRFHLRRHYFFLVFDAVVYTNYVICTTHWITTGKHLLTLLTTSAWNQAPMPTQAEPALCVGWNEYLAKAGGVNRHIAWHQPVHVVSQCSLMLGWCLASGDQRRLTGSGGTLETWSQRCCIQMAAFTLLYFTGNRKFSIPHLHSTLPLAGLPSEYFITNFVVEKLEWRGYTMLKQFWRYVYLFRQNTRTWQTDTTQVDTTQVAFHSYVIMLLLAV